MINLKKKLLQRFSREDDGSVAIEFALVVPVLAGMFLATVDLSGTGFTKSNMSSALRFSGQYIVNGGTDISVAESIFARSYGKQYSSFSATMKCSCARSRHTIDTNGGEQESEPEAASVSGDTRDLPKCTLDCGEDPQVQFLNFEAVVVSNAILGEDRTIRDSLSVRLK